MLGKQYIEVSERDLITVIREIFNSESKDWFER